MGECVRGCSGIVLCFVLVRVDVGYAPAGFGATEGEAGWNRARSRRAGRPTRRTRNWARAASGGRRPARGECKTVILTQKNAK